MKTFLAIIGAHVVVFAAVIVAYIAAFWATHSVGHFVVWVRAVRFSRQRGYSKGWPKISTCIRQLCDSIIRPQFEEYTLTWSRGKWWMKVTPPFKVEFHEKSDCRMISRPGGLDED